jgi:hypothetical protein
MVGKPSMAISRSPFLNLRLSSSGGHARQYYVGRHTYYLKRCYKATHALSTTMYDGRHAKEDR